MSKKKIFEVKNLKTSFRTEDGLVQAVDGVSYHVNEGEIVAIVGESGCGKSVTQFSALQLIKMPPGKIESGEVLFDGKDLLKLSQNGEEMRKVRGGGIGMIFQEPMTSLNPALTIGQQIVEAIQLHSNASKAEAEKRAIKMLKTVGIPDPEMRMGYYPHQFSGGMCQRAMIAMALSCHPKLLIADEATTALDVTMQEQILDQLQKIVQEMNTSVVMITHNLGIVARYADRIYVLYAGRVVESGTTNDIFYHPTHPYTKGLLKAVPRLDIAKTEKLVPVEGNPMRLINKPQRCDFYNRCPYATPECEKKPFPTMQTVGEGHEVACHRVGTDMMPVKQQASNERRIKKSVDMTQKPLLSVSDLDMTFYGAGKKMMGKPRAIKVLDNVGFDVYPGETLGLVGESGCGKSTVARCVLRMYEPTGGNVTFKGQDITHLKPNKMRPFRKEMQLIFQDPFSSLDPRQNAGSIVAEPLKIHKMVKTADELNHRVDERLDMVGLGASQRERMPHEFSGGQRQRLGIARALALNPSLLICDEPISALDVSIQAQIINLLDELQERLGLSYLFIAHDLSVVRHISDRVAVMYLGRIVEMADWKEIYDNPKHPYTRALLSAVPIPDPEVDKARTRIAMQGEVPSVSNRPSGCSFHNRCPYATEECKTVKPPQVECGI
ncbi:MAG: ABC transporter ATP-binding protein, partial [Clostridia bacterium]|nr:ABC transporter ATP-binding protein [Clostridia bacterium]